MKDGNKVKAILETLLTDKFGKDKYVSFKSDIPKFKESVIRYIQDEMKKQGVGPGPATVLIQSAIRQINKKQTVEDVLMVLSETMFKIV